MSLMNALQIPEHVAEIVDCIKAYAYADDKFPQREEARNSFYATVIPKEGSDYAALKEKKLTQLRQDPNFISHEAAMLSMLTALAKAELLTEENYQKVIKHAEPILLHAVIIRASTAELADTTEANFFAKIIAAKTLVLQKILVAQNTALLMPTMKNSGALSSAVTPPNNRREAFSEAFSRQSDKVRSTERYANLAVITDMHSSLLVNDDCSV